MSARSRANFAVETNPDFWTWKLYFCNTHAQAIYIAYIIYVFTYVYTIVHTSLVSSGWDEVPFNSKLCGIACHLSNRPTTGLWGNCQAISWHWNHSMRTTTVCAFSNFAGAAAPSNRLWGRVLQSQRERTQRNPFCTWTQKEWTQGLGCHDSEWVWDFGRQSLRSLDPKWAMIPKVLQDVVYSLYS